MVESDQFLLGSADERCRTGASRMGALVKEAQRANGFTLSTVGGMVGKDAVAAHRAFDVEEPSTVMQLIAAVLLLDKSNTWLRGVCRLVGGEFIERPRLTPEQKLTRLVETLRRHGKAGEAFIGEAFGEEAP